MGLRGEEKCWWWLLLGGGGGAGVEGVRSTKRSGATPGGRQRSNTRQ